VKCVAKVAVTAALSFVAGCGGVYDSSVTGVVTLNSATLNGGTVKFSPEGAGPSAYGPIDTSGNYTIMTGREEGLPSGRYIVTVVANQPSIPNANPSLPPMPGKPITPAWYRSADSSPLRFTVEPGSNEINLDLNSQPPAGWNTARRQ
jgi:hypothetical protein